MPIFPISLPCEPSHVRSRWGAEVASDSDSSESQADDMHSCFVSSTVAIGTTVEYSNDAVAVASISKAAVMRNGLAVACRLGLMNIDLRSLTALDLANRGLTATDAAALCPFLQGSTLTNLRLGYNQLRDAGAAAVAAVLVSQVSIFYFCRIIPLFC